MFADAELVPVDPAIRPEWLCGRELKAVFLAPYPQHQDTAHLLARYRLAAEVIPLARNHKSRHANGSFLFGQREFYWPELAVSADEVLGRIENALRQEPDLVVMAPQPAWTDYPEALRQQILALVGAGKTLVLLQAHAQAVALGDGTPFAAIPGAPLETITASWGRLGQGRILSYSDSIDPTHGFFVSDCECRSGFEASLLFFAACLAGTSAAGPTLRMAFNPTDGSLQLEANSPGLLRLQLHDWENYGLLDAMECQADGAPVSYRLPPLPAGEYLAEARLYDSAGALLALAAARCTCTNSLVLEECALSVEQAAPGDEVQVRCRAAEPHPGQLTVQGRWFDGWGRLLEVAPPVPFAELYAARVPQSSLSVINVLELTFSSNDRPLRRVSLELTLPGNLRPHPFPFLLWNLTENFSWKQRCYLDALRRRAGGSGLCNCSRQRPAARYAALSHLQTVPYATWFHKVGLDDCLFNPDWLEETRQKALAAVRNHQPYAPFGYTLGDECYVDAFTKGGRFSASPTAWKRFREFLKKLYDDDLDHLNRQWETEFPGWDDVFFSSDRELLRSFDNPSPWTDFRMFIADVFAGIFRGLRQEMRQLQPGALVGWDGCEEYSSYDGIDWWEFTRDMDINVVYAGSTLGGTNGCTNRSFNAQAVASFNPQAPCSGAFMNSVHYHYGPEFSSWYLLLHGYNSVWWWHATHPDPECGALQWSLEPGWIASGVAAALQEIRQGADLLLTHARKVTSPVAIHYSACNFHASTLESGTGNHINNIGITTAEFFLADKTIGRTIKADAELEAMFGGITPAGHYAPAHKNFHLLLRDLGLQPQIMARQQIEQGSLQRPACAVMILPFVAALSEAEVTALRDFVAEGGLLIADYHCGIRDLHGKVRPQPALDELFGVRHRSLAPRRQRQKVSIEYNFSRGGTFEVLFHDDIELLGSGCVLDAYDDGTPTVNTGTSVFGCHDDGAPAFIVNHFGQGKTLLLNFDVYGYEAMRRQQRHLEWLETFRYALWKLAGLKTPLTPEFSHGGPIGTVETVCLTDAGNVYYGIIPDFAVMDKRPLPARIPFARGKHLYNVRTREYLGDGPQAVTLEPGKPLLFAELPDRITGLDLEAPAMVAAGKPLSITVRLRTASGKPVVSAVRADVRLPDGTSSECYGETLYLSDGSASLTFVPALNDPPGTWEIRFVDCISGCQATAPVAVTGCETRRP